MLQNGREQRRDMFFNVWTTFNWFKTQNAWQNAEKQLETWRIWHDVCLNVHGCNISKRAIYRATAETQHAVSKLKNVKTRKIKSKTVTCPLLWLMTCVNVFLFHVFSLTNQIVYSSHPWERTGSAGPYSRSWRLDSHPGRQSLEHQKA